MSEHDDEQDEAPEPVGATETADEDEEAQESAESIEGPDVPGDEAPQAAERQASAEKQVKEISKQLDGERKRHTNRMSAILGDASTETLMCPLCGDGLQGWVFPRDAETWSEEQRQAALAFLGEGSGSELRPAEGVEECPRCNGWGQLAYPTKNVHMQNQTCPACGGNGYVTKVEQSTNVTQLPGSSAGEPAPVYEAGPTCPICGTPGMAGKPHYCVPRSAAAG